MITLVVFMVGFLIPDLIDAIRSICRLCHKKPLPKEHDDYLG